ncbi:MAG: serine/threonine protein kinase [Deltaproteobacteria bacterium]|nr:serine/threonine protein kinase [Deltaproteobacteria bacterium]
MSIDPIGSAGTVVVFGPPGGEPQSVRAMVAALNLQPRFVERRREVLGALHEHQPEILVFAPWSDRCAAVVNDLEAQSPGYIPRCIAIIGESSDSLLGRLLAKRGLAGVFAASEGPERIVDVASALLRELPPEPPTLPPYVSPSCSFSTTELFEGQKVAGRFMVKELLGKGGSAEVYRVRDLELNQDLALKLVRPDSAVPQVEDRFRQELAITRKLAHPNIVRTFEFGNHHDRLYFTMELLEGPTMQVVFEERFAGPWPCVGLDRMADVARALAAAHDAGVVHRDVKPDNVFLVEGGRVAKLADFGIAKPASASMAQTQAGTVLGTLEYMAPERLITDVPATPAADTYAIGVMLYVDWTGRLPFTGDSDGELVDAICHSTPKRPRELNPACPQGVESLIQRLIHKRARRRLADAGALAAQLDALAAQYGGGPA